MFSTPPSTSPARSEPQGEPHGLEGSLRRSALALTGDASEAQALVSLVLARARELRGSGAEIAPAQLFRMLRESYHSVVRTRTRRPMRDAALTAMHVAADRDPTSAPG